MTRLSMVPAATLGTFSTPAHALHLLGDRPSLVLSMEPWHLCVTLSRDGDRFVGSLPSAAALTDRLRLDGRVRFFCAHDGVATLAGEALVVVQDTTAASRVVVQVLHVAVEGDVGGAGGVPRT
jgi:hypothetical protein